MLAPLLTVAFSGALLTVEASAQGAVSAARGATRVPVLAVTLLADCANAAPVAVRELAVRQHGLGDAADIAGITVLQGRTRLAPSVAVDRRSRTAVLRPRGLALDPCDRRTLTVAVTLSEQAAPGGEHRFSLARVTAESGGAVRSGATDAAPQDPPAVVQPADATTVRLTPLPLLRRISYGGNRTIFRFLLRGGTDDVVVDAITFFNAGSASGDDLQRLRIASSGGESLSDTVAALQGEVVRIPFSSPLSLGRHQERMLQLLADVRASIRRTVRMELQEASDIEWRKRGR